MSDVERERDFYKALAEAYRAHFVAQTESELSHYWSKDAATTEAEDRADRIRARVQAEYAAKGGQRCAVPPRAARNGPKLRYFRRSVNPAAPAETGRFRPRSVPFSVPPILPRNTNARP